MNRRIHKGGQPGITGNDLSPHRAGVEHSGQKNAAYAATGRVIHDLASFSPTRSASSRPETINNGAS